MAMLSCLLLCSFMILLPIVAVSEVIPEEVASNKYIRFVPRVVVLQYAGNMGLAAIGVGYENKTCRYGVQFLYGYLPKQISGVEVKTIAVKGFLQSDKRHPFKGVTTSNYAGFNFQYARTKNTYTFFPDYFPQDYYSPNALHIAPFFGGKMDFDIKSSNCISKAGVFVEVGTLDNYLITYAKNSGVIKFSDMWNISVGFSISLNRLATLKTFQERI
jgi:hypothetical protein